MKMSVVAILGEEQIDVSAPEHIEMAKRLGRELAKKRVATISSSSYGFSLYVAQGIADERGFVTAVSPAASHEEYDTIYRLPRAPFSTIVHSGLGHVGVISILARSSHALILSGSDSTLSCKEFFAKESGFPIVVYGVKEKLSSQLRKLCEKRESEGGAIFYEEDPERVLNHICVN